MREPTYYFDKINLKKIHKLMSTCDIMDLPIFTPTRLVSVWIILPLAEAYLWGYGWTWTGRTLVKYTVVPDGDDWVMASSTSLCRYTY